jgi:hypothetical protein
LTSEGDFSISLTFKEWREVIVFLDTEKTTYRNSSHFLSCPYMTLGAGGGKVVGGNPSVS